jgi:2-(1,2-epoxy-1,2-dihydrophenyl)acetyl-CoA isomerase
MPAPEVTPQTDWRVENGIGWLTITRPRVLNAIDPKMLDEFTHHFTTSAMQEDVRVVVLTGQGKTFSTGGDLNIMRESMGNADEVRQRLRLGLERAVTAMWDLEKPVIACVNGTAFGAGMNLALACDLVIASREAQFQQTFIKVGLGPDTGGSWFLPRLVGMHKAKELLFFGDTLSATDAQQLGIVNHIVEHDDLVEWTTKYAERLAQASTKAIGLTKRAVNRAHTTSLKEALENEAQMQAQLTTTAEHQQAVKAFFERRKRSE